MPRNGSSISRAAPLLALALGLAGCGRLLPFGPATLDLATTQGIVRPAAATGLKADAPQAVDPTDWEALRLAAAGSLLDAAPGAALDWANPATGTFGTAVPIAAAQTRADGDCRVFSTTLSDVRGIRRYRIEACARPGGRFDFVTVTADDATLL